MSEVTATGLEAPATIDMVVEGVPVPDHATLSGRPAPFTRLVEGSGRGTGRARRRARRARRSREV